MKRLLLFLVLLVVVAVMLPGCAKFKSLFNDLDSMAYGEARSEVEEKRRITENIITLQETIFNLEDKLDKATTDAEKDAIPDPPDVMVQ